LTHIVTTNMTMPVLSADVAQAPQNFFRVVRQ
jgi:hypothetical protein